MRSEHKIVFISTLLGLSVWVANSFIDYLFLREGRFWESLIYRVPAHDIFVRLAGVVPILILASIISRVLGKSKRAEEALRESEGRLRDIASGLPGVIYQFLRMKDGSLWFPFISAGIYEASGLTPEEIQKDARKLFDRIVPEDIDRVGQVVTEGARRMETWEVEFRAKDQHGDIKWLRTSSSPHPLPDGSVLWNGVALDITQRKKVEEALRESEEFSSNLLSNSPNPMLVINEDSSVRYVNPALEKLTGFPSAEVVGVKAPYPWWTEETLQKTSEDLWDAMRKGAKRLEELFQKKDGERFWVEITSVPVRGNGKLRYCLANWVDITERKKAEQALLESEEKYRLVSENIPVVVYSALPDEHSTNVLVTGRILELTGYSGEQFMEDPELSGRIVHPEDREHVWKKIEEHREKKIPLEVEYRIITKDNTVKWIRDKATPMVDENGQIIRIDGFMEDITNRRKAKEALRQSENKYRKLFCNAEAAMFCSRLDGSGFLDFNDKACEIFGYAREELLNMPAASLWADPQDRDKMTKLLTENGTLRDYEISIKRKSGEIRTCLISMTLYPEAGYLEGTAADITERKSAEEALRESEEK
jgi:PAS domain S-box-containing protein